LRRLLPFRTRLLRKVKLPLSRQLLYRRQLLQRLLDVEQLLLEVVFRDLRHFALPLAHQQVHVPTAPPHLVYLLVLLEGVAFDSQDDVLPVERLAERRVVPGVEIGDHIVQTQNPERVLLGHPRLKTS
jgi:hypothetical protein